MCSTDDQNLLNEVDYHIKDIGFAVNSISLSTKLPQQPHHVFMNIETKESEKFTIQLNNAGFKVVSHEFDLDQSGSAKYPITYETIYALLQEISPSYVNSFGNALSAKLQNLAQ